MSRNLRVIFILLFLSCLTGAYSQTKDLRQVIPDDNFLIIGHMGAPNEEPENTMPSFKKAVELGANALETDLSITKDGHLVHWHDWNPDEAISYYRQLGKQGLKYRPTAPNIWEDIRKDTPDLTLEELRNNFGYVITDEDSLKEGEKRKAEVQIPTFDEFCAWLATEPRVKKVFLDIKIPADGKKFVKPYFSRIVSTMKKHNVIDRGICMLPRPEITKEVAKHFDGCGLDFCWDQELPGAIIIRPKKFSTATKAIKAGTTWCSIGRPVLTLMGYKIYKKILKYDLKIKKIHNFFNPEIPLDGVVAWTIDDPDEMKEITLMGVNGMVTNKPGVLRKIVNQLQQNK